MMSCRTGDDAQRLLENPASYPGLVNRKRAQQSFRLWRQPAFDPDAAWSLLNHDDKWFVRRVVYDCARDAEDGTISHDTYGSEVRLPDGMATELLGDLARISLPPFASMSGHIGLDGCTYGIQFGNYMKDARLSWWCEAPPEWAEFRDWYAHALSEFERALPDCSVQIQARHPWVE